MKRPSFFQRLASGARFVFGGSGNYESARREPTRSEILYQHPSDAREEISALDRDSILRVGRSLEKNSGFFREIQLCNSIYSVGDGMRPQPRSSDAAWNAKARAWFSAETAFPEITGRFPMWKVQDIVCRLLDSDGEVFAIHAENENGRPKLQFMEAHRLSRRTDASRGIADGIRFSKWGKPVSYFFRDGEVETEVSAADVIHVFSAGRFSETRGVSPAQHAFNDIRDGRDLDAIEKATDKHVSGFGLVVTSAAAASDDEGFDDPFTAAASGGSACAASVADAPFRRIAGAQAPVMKPGEEVKVLESNRPSPAWLGLRAAIDNAAALGNVPLGFLSDPSKLGGASTRLVVGKAARLFSRRQQELISQFLDKAWLFFIGWAIAHGELDAPEGWWRVEWTTPRKLTVDNGRDASQIREDIRAGLYPVEDDYAERGLDFADELRAKADLVAEVQRVCAEKGVDPALILPVIFAEKRESTPKQ